MQSLRPVLLREGNFKHFNVPDMLPPLLGFKMCAFPPQCRAFQCCFLPEALVDLMAAVVRLCPSVCESSHLAVLLGAYGATLSVLGEEVCGDRVV